MGDDRSLQYDSTLELLCSPLISLFIKYTIDQINPKSFYDPTLFQETLSNEERYLPSRVLKMHVFLASRSILKPKAS